MRIKNKRVKCFLLAVLSLLMLFPIQALAAGPIDTSSKCSLSISFRPKGLKASGVEFKLYHVADVTTKGSFNPTETFKPYSVMELLQEPEAEDYRVLSSTLPGYIAADKISASYSNETDMEGKVTFSNLPTGLYLVIGDVYHGNGAYYTPDAFMACLPNRDIDDLWIYDLEAEAKWTYTPDSDSMDIHVLKVWSDIATNTHGKDKITVELYDGETLYDTQVLSKENNWQYQWKELYGGTKWSVHEKSSPDGYKVTISGQGTHQVVITNTKEEPNPEEPNKKLPQTGLLWWPVPLLLAAGISFILIGYRRRTRE